MTVGIILQGKGSDVITARGTTPLRDICSTLAEKGIGAILVTDAADHIEGIISERDIVKTLAAKGPEALNLPASNVMTTAVVTCGEDDAIMDVMSKMTSGRFRHVPVLRDGKVVGLISIGDAVKYRIAQVEMEAEQMRTYITMT
ncbi:CBS domain-containing protein [Roseibium sp.]|uniref:CBS domain-containing protein n=1 Tax=Roseibium sp. TaxID=1936156 RepID=UPI003A97729E